MTTYLAVTFLAVLAELEFLGIRAAYRRTRQHPLATTLQVGLSRLDRGSADYSSGEPPPASGSGHPGAGPKHRATTAPPLHPARPSPDGGGPARSSAGTSDPPCLVPAGSHPAPGPETDAGNDLLCACTGGTVICHGCPHKYTAPGAPVVGAGAPGRRTS